MCHVYVMLARAYNPRLFSFRCAQQMKNFHMPRLFFSLSRAKYVNRPITILCTTSSGPIAARKESESFNAENCLTRFSVKWLALIRFMRNKSANVKQVTWRKCTILRQPVCQKRTTIYSPVIRIWSDTRNSVGHNVHRHYRETEFNARRINFFAAISL